MHQINVIITFLYFDILGQRWTDIWCWIKSVGWNNLLVTGKPSMSYTSRHVQQWGQCYSLDQTVSDLSKLGWYIWYPRRITCRYWGTCCWLWRCFWTRTQVCQPKPGILSFEIQRIWNCYTEKVPIDLFESKWHRSLFILNARFYVETTLFMLLGKSKGLTTETDGNI